MGSVIIKRICVQTREDFEANQLFQYRDTEVQRLQVLRKSLCVFVSLCLYRYTDPTPQPLPLEGRGEQVDRWRLN